MLHTIGNRRVESLRFLSKSRGSPFAKTIGSGHAATVYPVKIRFEGAKSAKRAAAKVFSERVTREQAVGYYKIIEELRRAGVRLPKMGFVQLPNPPQWILVMESYAGKSGSRLKRQYGFGWHIEDKKVREETIVELAKVANAGYYPHEHTVDVLDRPIRGFKTILHDLHMVFEKGKLPVGERAKKLLENIWMMTDDIPERYRLLGLAKRSANRELGSAIGAILSKPVYKRLFESSSKIDGYL